MGILETVTQFVLFIGNVLRKYFGKIGVGVFEQSKIHKIAKQCLHPIEKEDDLRVKSFSEIPGPRSFPFIGSQWLYLWPGPYHSDKLHLANEDKYFKYGPVVKEHYFWNFPILHLYDKSDIEKVLKCPSKFPIRPEMEALSTYRRSCPDRYSTVGIASSQGLEWHNLRYKLASKVVSPALGTKIVKELSLVSDELIEKLRTERDANLETVAQFEKYVYRFDLEVMMRILMNKRLGALEDSVPLLAKRLIHVSDRLFEICHETMYGFPWWKYFPTRSFRDLMDNENEIYDVFSELVREALNKPGMERSETSVLDDILNTEDVDIRDKIVTLIDLVSGGIATTGNAVIFLLNSILANPRIKAKVHEELDLVLLQPDTPQIYTPQLLSKLKYLRACIAESMRLSPVTPNLARLLEKDFNFQRYHAPAGSVVICQTWVASLLEENYQNAREFIPERWLPTDGVSRNNPYFEVPFGIGKRMCPGKRIAEYQLLVLTAKLLTNFDMSFEKPVEAIYKFIITPKSPLRVSLKDRKVNK